MICAPDTSLQCFAGSVGQTHRPPITDLTPTGRGGGFVRVSKVPLAEVLRNYDAAYPAYTEMPRDSVIAHYLRVQQERHDA